MCRLIIFHRLFYDKRYNKSKCGQQLWKIYQKNLVKKSEKYV